MPQVGDIVKIRQLEGRWAVIGPHLNGIPPGRLWKVRRASGGRPAEGRVVGDGDLEVLAHPIFTAGQLVRFFGNDAEVLTDNGDTIRLRYLHLRPRSLDRMSGRFWRTPTVAIGEADVERGELVAEQLAFVRGRTTDG